MYGIDCENGFMGVYLSPYTPSCMYEISTAFCRSDLNKVVLRQINNLKE